jgi:hypothetical protein
MYFFVAKGQHMQLLSFWSLLVVVGKEILGKHWKKILVVGVFLTAILIIGLTIRHLTKEKQYVRQVVITNTGKSGKDYKAKYLDEVKAHEEIINMDDDISISKLIKRAKRVNSREVL